MRSPCRQRNSGAGQLPVDDGRKARFAREIDRQAANFKIELAAGKRAPRKRAPRARRAYGEACRAACGLYEPAARNPATTSHGSFGRFEIRDDASRALSRSLGLEEQSDEPVGAFDGYNPWQQI
jgi:hypothetical protein